jgi:hypothetical protein
MTDETVPEWYDDDAKVDAFVSKHRGKLIEKLGLGDLFASSEPAPKPAKVEGGGQKVKATEQGDAMTELVTALVKGIKAEARESRSGNSEATKPEPKVVTVPTSWRERFWRG